MTRRLFRTLRFPMPVEDPRALAEQLAARARASSIVGSGGEQELRFVAPASLVVVIGASEARFSLDESAHLDEDPDCWAYYFVALGSGEQLRVVVEGGDLRVAEIARREVGSWYDPTYGWVPAELGAGAPYAGWYRVKLSTAKQRGAAPIVTWDASR